MVAVDESQDNYWMQRALALAERAVQAGEVPVGALLVSDNRVLAEGYNQCILRADPTAHAEIVAIRQGCEQLSNYRLPGVTLYVTLEPCVMCVGAIVHARIARLVYGATDPRAGAVVSQMAGLEAHFLNHRVCHVGGILAYSCGEILSNFFKERRKK